MTQHKYTDTIEYETVLAPNSPFPEWITTDSLHLRRFTPEAVPPQELYTAFTENEGTDKYFTTDSGLGTTFADVYDHYDLVAELWEDGTNAFYAMFTRETDDFIGLATFESVEFDKKRSEIGIWLQQQYWGNGYAQERAEALLEVGFTHLNLDLIEITVVPENTNSVRAVTKYMTSFGGSFDGRLRRATHTPTGEVHDVYKWSITADEFNDPDATYQTQPDEPSV